MSRRRLAAWLLPEAPWSIARQSVDVARMLLRVELLVLAAATVGGVIGWTFATWGPALRRFLLEMP